MHSGLTMGLISNNTIDVGTHALKPVKWVIISNWP